ncbi:MAG TPA: carboxylesterase family protein [Candidatus Anoxymicrobiaceae bacterium]
MKRSWSSLVLEGTLRDLRSLFIDKYYQDDLRLSDEMIGYWTRFVKTGDPNTKGVFAWPDYQAATDRNIELQVPFTVKAGLENNACNLADSFYAQFYPGL